MNVLHVVQRCADAERPHDVDDLSIKVFLRNNLRIVTDHEGDRLTIKLVLCDDVISTDVIDYSEVVRVVERENKHTVN